jgi:Cytochrome C and Quinol oxidase polypeptide I
MTEAAPHKTMTEGEALMVTAFSVLALLALAGAAKAEDTAPHGRCERRRVFGIFNHYFDRPAELPAQEIEGRPNYHFGPVKLAIALAVFWGIAGFLVGLWAALELAWPVLNFDLPWFNFGRIRPLHTSAVIFAFGGNVLIATSFYVVQKTCRVRIAGELAPWFVVLGYNFFIVIAGTGYLLGVTQSKEYAEPEWYADLWLTIVWVVYLLVFLCTLIKRKEPHIFVANWFYLAFIVTIAVLHLGNNPALPVSVFGSKSYIAWGGVQDAMFQWWYGHNAVGFFLTAGFLAIMYYFVPKRAERPIYSYRLSIVHFWSLIFLYIWAGPHHLHYTALPDWAQTLGMTFSIMLWMPSWGGHDQWIDDAVGRLGQAAHRSRAAHAGGVGRLLRNGDLRRPADVGQGRQLAQPLYRLDHRSRAFRCARLGRLRVVRRHLLPGSLAVGTQAALQPEARQLALLDRDHRHRVLYLGHVGVGHPAGPDVARIHLRRVPRIFLHRDGGGDASVLRDPGSGRRAVSRWRADHGLQSLDDRPAWRGDQRLPPHGTPARRMRTSCRSGSDTKRSRRIRSSW